MLPGESWHTVASVSVDSVDTSGSITTRIAETFIDVVLAITARCSRLASALIATNKVFAMAAELARIGFAFIDLRLAQESVVAWMTLAGEGIDAVDAISMMAG
jgi:hypothetical protein